MPNNKKIKWSAMSWGPEHDRILQLLFENDPPLVTKTTTPKEMCSLSEDFKKRIYEKFKYGTVANKVRNFKKYYFSGVPQGGKDETDNDNDVLLDDPTEDDDNENPVFKDDAVPAMTKVDKVDAGTVSRSVATIPENQVEIDKIVHVDDPPFIKQFTDIDMTWHTVIRFVPPQGLVITEDDLDLLFIKQSGARDGRSWEIRYPTPSLLYDIREEILDEEWDEVWGSSSFQGKAAMMNKSLEIRNVYEQQNIIWRALHIDLDEPMEVIEGLKLRAKGNFCVISLCLRGPTSDLKKREDSENALKKKRKIC